MESETNQERRRYLKVMNRMLERHAANGLPQLTQMRPQPQSNYLVHYCWDVLRYEEKPARSAESKAALLIMANRMNAMQLGRSAQSLDTIRRTIEHVMQEPLPHIEQWSSHPATTHSSNKLPERALWNYMEASREQYALPLVFFQALREHMSHADLMHWIHAVLCYLHSLIRSQPYAQVVTELSARAPATPIVKCLQFVRCIYEQIVEARPSTAQQPWVLDMTTCKWFSRVQAHTMIRDFAQIHSPEPARESACLFRYWWYLFPVGERWNLMRQHWRRQRHSAANFASLEYAHELEQEEDDEDDYEDEEDDVDMFDENDDDEEDQEVEESESKEQIPDPAAQQERQSDQEDEEEEKEEDDHEDPVLESAPLPGMAHASPVSSTAPTLPAPPASRPRELHPGVMPQLIEASNLSATDLQFHRSLIHLFEQSPLPQLRANQDAATNLHTHMVEMQNLMQRMTQHLAQAEMRQQAVSATAVQHVNLRALRVQPDYTYWFIERSNLLSSMLNNVCENEDDTQALRLPLTVRFTGEEQANDQGGVRRESFELFFAQWFSENQPLWACESEKGTYWPLPSHSSQTPETIQNVATLWRRAGLLYGLALYHGQRVVFRMPAPLFHYHWRQLTNDTPAVTEFDELERIFQKSFPSIHARLQQMRTFNDLEWDAAELTYEYAHEAIWCLQDVSHPSWHTLPLQERLSRRGDDCALLPKADMAINTRNFQDYYERVVRFHCELNYNAMHFMQGMLQILPSGLCNVFTEHEFYTCFCLPPQIRWQDLRPLLKFRNVDTQKEEQQRCVTWCQEILESWSSDQLTRFVAFVTSSRSLNAQILVYLNPPSDQALVSAHTCVNSLILPQYSSKVIMEQKLLQSLEHCEGFGLE